MEEDGFFFFLDVPDADVGARVRVDITGEVVAEVDVFFGADVVGLVEVDVDAEVDGLEGVGRVEKVVDGDVGFEDEVDEDEDVGRLFDGWVEADLRWNEGSGGGFGAATDADAAGRGNTAARSET